MENLDEIRNNMREDVYKLIAWIQQHEELFDDLKTHYSIDETLTDLITFCFEEVGDIIELGEVE